MRKTQFETRAALLFPRWWHKTEVNDLLLSGLEWISEGFQTCQTLDWCSLWKEKELPFQTARHKSQL